MSKTFEVKYLVLPDFVFNNEKLTLASMKIYAFIHNYRMPEFFYGNEKLAALFNYSERTISRAITQLEEEGYIKSRFDGRKRFIDDLYFTHRVDKNVYSESPNMSMQSQAGDSTPMSTLPQASTAESNKNNLIKKDEETFEGDPKDSEAFEAWKAAKKNKKQNKGRGVFAGRGYQQPPFPKRNDYQEAPKKGVAMGEDIP